VGPAKQRDGRDTGAGMRDRLAGGVRRAVGEGDAVASERLSAPRGLRRWRVGLRRGEGEGDAVWGAGRCASACWAARRCGSGRGAGWSARAREREKRGEGWACELGCWVGHWAEMVWGLGSFSNPFPFLFLFLSKSNPNSNSRQMNSNLNLNSHKHSTNKTMLQHDATTKIKPMIHFNYL
jgi:hypothetical protein